ncbi:hypothetical protein GCM10020254_86630 [Streptomyces goshikiensis]
MEMRGPPSRPANTFRKSDLLKMSWIARSGLRGFQDSFDGAPARGEVLRGVAVTDRCGSLPRVPVGARLGEVHQATLLSRKKRVFAIILAWSAAAGRYRGGNTPWSRMF